MLAPLLEDALRAAAGREGLNYDQLLAERGVRFGITELARQAGVSKTSVRRVLEREGSVDALIADRMLFAVGRSLADLAGYVAPSEAEHAYGPSEDCLHVDPSWEFFGAGS